MAGQLEAAGSSTLLAAKAVSRSLSQAALPSELRTEFGGERSLDRSSGWRLAAAPGRSRPKARRLSKARFATTDWIGGYCAGTVLTDDDRSGHLSDPDYGLNNLAILRVWPHQDYWYRVEFKAPTESARAKTDR